MKKTSIIFLIVVLAISVTHSQDISRKLIIKNEKRPAFVAGVNFSGYFEKIRDTATWEWDYAYSYELEPHISFYPIKNLGFGAAFGFSRNYSNFVYYKNFLWYGFYARYYIPYKIDYYLLDHLLFYCEVNYNRTNYLGLKKFEYPLVSDNLVYNLLNIPIGIQVDLWKGITYEMSYSFSTFFHQKWFIFPRVGLEYHFYKKEKDIFESF